MTPEQFDQHMAMQNAILEELKAILELLKMQAEMPLRPVMIVPAS
jgi:hypothetical protein